MNISEIQSTIKYLKETCDCVECKRKYEDDDIEIIATTSYEGLFNMRCQKCNSSSIVTVFLSPKNATQDPGTPQTKKTITQNDILDMKNFLNKFDGNFKKIFIQK